MKSNLTFASWLYYWLKGKSSFLNLLQEMARSQWLEYDAINAYQLYKMKEIIRFAKNNTAYYGELLKHVYIEDITNLSQIRLLPILTKAIIRENLPAIKSTRTDLIQYQTGGSTGVPLSFFCNPEFLFIQKMAANFMAYTQGGYRIGDKIGVIWGYDNDLPKRNFKAKLVNNFIFHKFELNSFRLSPANMALFASMLKKHNVHFLKGYANSLAEFAKYLLINHKNGGLKIRAVFSEAERLDDSKRSLIERALGAKVYNYYGSREFGTIAVECKAHHGLHINFEQLYVELVDDGKILITSFLNQGTPFIRYEIGDVAEGFLFDKCSCGRSSMRLSRIIGRESDNFMTKSGKLIHGEYITHLFYGTRNIEQFQVVQNSFQHFDFFIVTNDTAVATKELDKITLLFKAHFDNDIFVHIHFVDTIDKTKTGKYKFTVCNI